MNRDEAELAIKAIQRLNQYAEGLCQQLQDARATIALMSDAALEREKEIARLREALAIMAECTSCPECKWHAGTFLKGEDDATE